MPAALDLLTRLRAQCEDFFVRPEGVYISDSDEKWAMAASDTEDLTAQLEAGGHLVSWRASLRTTIRDGV